MNGVLEWIAAIGTIIAAALVVLDLGRYTTGWGFVLFVIVSIAWIISGMLNGALLLVNGWGVWRYLLNPERSQIKANTP